MVLARPEGAPSKKSYVLYVVEIGRPITQSKIFIWKPIGESSERFLIFSGTPLLFYHGAPLPSGPLFEREKEPMWVGKIRQEGNLT